MSESESLFPTSSLPFKRVELLKDSSLGAGSYGAVCKARCDDLVCAAKVLHLPPSAATVNSSDNGGDEAGGGGGGLMRLVRRECELLSGIQHPNIVQYLGTWRDPSTRLPVLLMELMDESLTQFLDRQQGDLPYHTQVNVCHDVALALSFLHNSDIIHRDLSSNNVLMIGDRRAKVADFGVAKLWDVSLQNQQNSLSKRPGCEVYMPPEAFSGKYTVKIDCFSFGVLTIQILTGLFPQPSNQFKLVQVNDPNFPDGIEARASEAERRKEHTDLISPDNPLLPLALDCIADKEGSRPTSQEICARLATLKETSQFSNSLSQSGAERVIEYIEKQVMDLQDLSLPSVDTTDGSGGGGGGGGGGRGVSSSRDSTPSRADEAEERVAQIQALQAKIQMAQGKEAVLKNQVEQLSREVKSANRQLEEQQALLRKSQDRDSGIEERVNALEKEIERKEQVITSLREETGPMELKRVELKWMPSDSTPGKWSRTDDAIVSVTENIVIMRPGSSTEIYSYNLAKKAWSRFPDTPVEDCGLAVIKRKLTVVGGRRLEKNGGGFTSRLLSLVETAGKKEWIVIYPPMSTQRCSPVIIHCQGSLVVAGGEGEGGYLRVVEVLDTETSVWQRVADLPNPLVYASTSQNGSQLYILGGWVEKMVPTYSVLSCSLKSLLSSGVSSAGSGEGAATSGSDEEAQQASGDNSSNKRSNRSRSPWINLADLPLKGSSCVIARGRLLSVGGRDIHTPTSAIHIYNPLSNSWEVLSHMANARHQCFATVRNKMLLVIGGWKLNNNKQVMTESSTMEIATVLP